MDDKRVISWLGTDADRWESAYFDPGDDDGFVATGFQAGVDPEPYQLNYKLDVRDGFVHSHLYVWATGNGWHRELYLSRDKEGAWSWRTMTNGDCKLPSPGAAPELEAELQDSVDCDLGLSPLTNLMPVRRNRLHLDAGRVDVTVAWIAVPELSLQVAPQRYEHLRTHDNGAIVRFTALNSGFTADLEVDADGVVVDYPGMARRAQAQG